MIDAKLDKAMVHGYHRFYEQAFPPFQNKLGLRLLEIGLDKGASLITWLKYFKNAANDGIQGLDCEKMPNGNGRGDFCADGDAILAACVREHVEGCDRLRFFYGSQDDPAFLKRLVQEGAKLDPDVMFKGDEPPQTWVDGGWDIVIDDGSHLPRHQLVSFCALFPFVRPGGLYIIEDIESSYYNAPTPSLYGVKIRDAGTATTLLCVCVCG